MIEDVVKQLPTADSVIEYARVNGYDNAGIAALIEIWLIAQDEAAAPVIVAAIDEVITDTTATIDSSLEY